MSQLNVFILLSAVFVTITATPAVGVDASCIITKFSQVSSVVESCTNILVSNLIVPAGETLELNLKDNTKLDFEGTTKFEYAKWKGPLIKITGHKIYVTGRTDSLLDGKGDKYWDGKGPWTAKPKFLTIRATDSTFRNLNLLNCPIQCITIDGSDNLNVAGFNIDSSAGAKLGLNTDGFELLSTHNVVLKNSVISGQGDCVAVRKGSNAIVANVRCTGGKGLVLSVGQNKEWSVAEKTISNITFTGCQVTDSDYGIHVKTYSDAGRGALNGVTYENIKMTGIRKYAMNIQQDYENGKSTGNPKNNIPITDFTASHITGSLIGENSVAVKIFCAQTGCADWKWSDVSITNAQSPNICKYSPIHVC